MFVVETKFQKQESVSVTQGRFRSTELVNNAQLTQFLTNKKRYVSAHKDSNGTKSANLALNSRVLKTQSLN